MLSLVYLYPLLEEGVYSKLKFGVVLSFKKCFNQCSVVMNGTSNSQISFRYENQLVSHLVITSLKIKLTIFTQMKTCYFFF